MPRIPKKKLSTKIKKTLSTLAPMQAKRVKAIANTVGKLTPAQIIKLTPKTQKTLNPFVNLNKAKRESAIIRAAAEGKINLNKPISSIIRKSKTGKTLKKFF